MAATYQDPDLAFVWLEVSNLSHSVNFYRQTLGFPVTDETGAFAIVHLAHTRIYLGQGAPRGMGMYLAINVPDVDAKAEYMRRNGLAVTAPIDEGWARYLDVIDPDGYRLLIMQIASEDLP